MAKKKKKKRLKKKEVKKPKTKKKTKVKNKEIKEKPVGEILREEGIIKEEKREYVPEEPQKGSEEITKVLMDLEKVKAIVNTLREMETDKEEMINQLAESIGEIRSLFFQRDVSIKETISKVNKIEEIVNEIKPQKILKKFEKEEMEFEKISARIEKLEIIEKDLSKRVTKVEKILESIKSMENLRKIVKDIEDKLSRMKEIESSVKRDAAKAEKFYLETQESLEDFEKLKETTEKLDELTKEILRSLDEIKIEMDTKVTKEERNNTIKEALKVPESHKDERIKELESKKQEILKLIESIEKQKNQGIISEVAYQELLEKNNILIDKISKQLNRLKMSEEPENLLEWLTSIDEEVKEISEKFELNEIKIKGLEKKIDNLIAQIENLKSSISYLYEKKSELPEKKVSKSDSEKMRPTSMPQSFKESESLMEQKNKIKNLLMQIEDEYRKGTISEKVYREVKEKNLKLLEEVEKKINNSSEEKNFSTATEEEKIRELENKISFENVEGAEELRAMLEVAREKLKKGYRLTARRYIEEVEKKLKS